MPSLKRTGPGTNTPVGYAHAGVIIDVTFAQGAALIAADPTGWQEIDHEPAARLTEVPTPTPAAAPRRPAEPAKGPTAKAAKPPKPPKAPKPASASKGKKGKA